MGRRKQQVQPLELLHVPDVPLNAATVCALTGKSKKTIYRWERLGKWPGHFLVGSEVAWWSQEVEAALTPRQR